MRVVGIIFLVLLLIAFCAGCGFAGFAAAQAATFPKQEKWDAAFDAQHTHTVTIVWDDDDIETLHVRDDRDWTYERSLNSEYDLDGWEYGYSANGSNCVDIDHYSYSSGRWYNHWVGKKSSAEREGYKFKGLYSTPYGGIQYVSADGFGLLQVTGDITLYAVFERA